MFRRRPFRRIIPVRRHPFAPIAAGPRRALRNANNMMDNGNFAAAANIYDDLAKAALATGMMRHAPFLFLQTARARMLAGQLDQSIDAMQRGLNLLAETGRWKALRNAGKVAVDELKRQGRAAQAGEVQAWLDNILKDHAEVDEAYTRETDVSEQKPPRLPTKCPSCGGGIPSDEVEWIDEHTVECPYCGSAVQAEG